MRGEMWHAKRGCLLLRHLVPSHFGFAYVLLVDVDLFPELVMIFRTLNLEFFDFTSKFWKEQVEHMQAPNGT